VLSQELVEVHRPIRVTAAEFIAGVRPVVAVAAREVYPIDGEAAILERPPEAAK
jgi:hypothetical protein